MAPQRTPQLRWLVRVHQGTLKHIYRMKTNTFMQYLITLERHLSMQRFIQLPFLEIIHGHAVMQVQKMPTADIYIYQVLYIYVNSLELDNAIYLKFRFFVHIKHF